MWAVSTSANHIYVKGWHLQDTWCMMLTLYDYQRTFTSGFAGESWFSTANKAAKRPTSVGSTPVDVLGIFLDIFVVTKLCYLFFHETCRYFKCFFVMWKVFQSRDLQIFRSVFYFYGDKSMAIFHRNVTISICDLGDQNKYFEAKPRCSDPHKAIFVPRPNQSMSATMLRRDRRRDEWERETQLKQM